MKKFEELKVKTPKGTFLCEFEIYINRDFRENGYLSCLGIVLYRGKYPEYVFKRYKIGKRQFPKRLLRQVERGSVAGMSLKQIRNYRRFLFLKRLWQLEERMV